ncbi:MAG: hypothetical protein ACE5GJ_00595 [Gemmatimonadota bacterium]
MDGRAVRSVGDVHQVLETRRPGEEILLEWVSRGRRHEAVVTLAEDPALTIRAVPEAELPEAVRRQRSAWRAGG